MRARGSTAAVLRSALLLMVVMLSGPARAQAAQVVDDTSPRCVRASANMAGVHHAGLVVTFGDRPAEMFCVEFSEDSITGLQLLQRSGLLLVTSGGSGLGAAVCSIDGKGSQDPTNCFASCTGSPCAYWAYYQFVDDTWKFSSIGASQRAVHDGDIDGWAWGPGGVSSGAVPAQPGAICPPPVPTPTATVAPPPVESPTPVPTPRPARTPSLAATEAPPTIGAVTGNPSAPPPDAPTDVVAPQGPVAGDVAAPVETRQSGVQGIERAPVSPAASPSAAASATATPRTGAITVGAEQGKQNESHAEATRAGGGGSRTPLVAFAIVAGALLAGVGIVMYRRQRLG